jgi:hypothetical protein
MHIINLVPYSKLFKINNEISAASTRDMSWMLRSISRLIIADTDNDFLRITL